MRPLLTRVSARVSAALGRPFSSADYWERRYAAGGSSGVGSQGDLASFKAEIVNGFVEEHAVGSVVEFGCGDGEQLALLRCPRYVGLDVSDTAVRACRERFAADPGRTFFAYRPLGPRNDAGIFRADLALSLDVIYHLVEDEVYDEYLSLLFGAATRFVVIYAPDSDQPPHPLARHVRFRRFSVDVERRFPRWAVYRRVPNRYPYDPIRRAGSWSEFVIYRAGVDGRRPEQQSRGSLPSLFNGGGRV